MHDDAAHAPTTARPKAFPMPRFPLRREQLTRPWFLAACALALLVGAAPFVPRGEDPEPKPDAAQVAAGEWRTEGRITPEMQAEIDRVVAEGSAPVLGRGAAATSAARCATFAGERYCLGVGWTTRTEEQVQARLATAARTTPARRAPRDSSGSTGAEETGGLDAAEVLARRQRMSADQRARADRRELTAAARSVDKVRLVRAELQARALPDGTLGRPKAANDYSRRKTIMRVSRSREQNRYYWCGPATAQAITWGWRKRRQDQRLWARRLGTTSAGTAITDMVRVVNNNTGYDRKDRAGTYITLDISDFSFDKWYLLMMRHIEDYRAPVILHPVLEKRFYPYLDDDASGHFQVGRGFDQNPGGEPLLGYFEPWNQQRFDPSEPFIEREQWQSAYQQYRANQAHFQHNVGV